VAAAYFVTGTDTEVGKTFSACTLLARANQLGMRTLAFKPVAAGAELTAEGLRNEDGVALQAAINQPLPYDVVNPFCYEPAIAPHIAAQLAGNSCTVGQIREHFKSLLSRQFDFCLVEGAGGWRVPLNESESFSDIAVSLDLPVILVVAMRLGCISHALLTAEAIARDGLRLAGWVANQGTAVTMPQYQENLSTLSRGLPAPLLGEIPFSADGSILASNVSLPDHLEQAHRNL
jgi:dethiobiotin synthetase